MPFAFSGEAYSIHDTRRRNALNGFLGEDDSFKRCGKNGRCDGNDGDDGKPGLLKSQRWPGSLIEECDSS
jgi:hypothetical protein